MYFKQIDGIRALAVTLVFMYHWLPSVDFIHKYKLGQYGVAVFFVLSGFLITRILLVQKENILAKKTSILNALKKFYIRRSLRIFPIYYLFIFFLFALNFETIREEILWHFFYGSNILYVVNGEYSNGLAHLWSLSVEEQFYLIWPVLVFLIPFKHLKKFFIFSIVFGIISQFYLIYRFDKGSLLMFARMDAFGWGGLLSYIYFTFDNWKERIKKYKLAFYILLILFIGLHQIKLGIFGPILNNIFHLLSFFIIAKTISGFKGAAGKFLEHATIVYIGKISYGIYLYHNLMQWLVPYFADLLNIPFPSQSHEFQRFFIYLTLTIIVSSLSWYIIEKPVNGLKRKFSY